VTIVNVGLSEVFGIRLEDTQQTVIWCIHLISCSLYRNAIGLWTKCLISGILCC